MCGHFDWKRICGAEFIIIMLIVICRYDNVTLSPLVFQWGLRFGPIQRNGAVMDKKQFSNTKAIVKVETGIVTLISYHHYLKIVGNNKLWPQMQKESWNIHGTKILICAITLNGTES